MTRKLLTYLSLILLSPISMSDSLYAQINLIEISQVARYQKANQELKSQPNSGKRVIFYGNSITEAWVSIRPQFFAGKDWHGRGIGGQTSAQLLMRFYQDVVELAPKRVVLLAGTNDLAQNTGFISQEQIVHNLSAMLDIAKANNIEVLLCSVLPAAKFPWSATTQVPTKIMELNQKYKQLSQEKKITYIDYHSAMVDKRGGLAPEICPDEVHPNAKGYEIMEKVLRPYLD